MSYKIPGTTPLDLVQVALRAVALTAWAILG